MEDQCGSASGSGRFLVIPKSESKLTVGKKRGSVEVEEKSVLGHKKAKMRSLESVSHSEGRLVKDRPDQDIGPTHRQLDLNANACGGEDFLGDATPACVDTNRLSSHGDHEIDCVVDYAKSREFGLELNPADVSGSINHDPFYPYKNYANLKSRDDLECESSNDPVEERGATTIWIEMKQNGFRSSSHGGLPMPKPHIGKSKNDGLKKKIELAKREQVDKFAKIAAPCGLLNGLNLGIINQVRNSKQVHSIIEALVRSEKRENTDSGGKQPIQTKTDLEVFSNWKDQENFNSIGMNKLPLAQDYRPNMIPGSKSTSDCYPMLMNNSVSLNSDITCVNDGLSLVKRMFFGKITCPSQSNLDREDDVLALKLSSSKNIVLENTIALSNENSASRTNITSLSVKDFQWLELLHRDIKGRLTALRCSRKRIWDVIHTELPCLMAREFSSTQESNPYATKSSATEYSTPTADAHQARWGALFHQMDVALSEEEIQLESWLNQVKDMQLHCKGDFPSTMQLMVCNSFMHSKNDCSQNNVGVVIPDTYPLNHLQLFEEKRKNQMANTRSKVKENTTSSGYTVCQMAPNHNVMPKATLVQCELTEPKRSYAGKENQYSKRQLAQRARRQREQSRQCASVQPRFFPFLPKSCRRLSCLERESNKGSCFQSITSSTEIAHPVTKTAVATNILETSSTAMPQNIVESTTTDDPALLSATIMMQESECSKRQLGQCTRRQRERSKQCAPIQPRFFPSLPLSRRRRACLEREENKRSLRQSRTLSTEITHNLAESTTTDDPALLSATIVMKENLPQNLTPLETPFPHSTEIPDNFPGQTKPTLPDSHGLE